MVMSQAQVTRKQTLCISHSHATCHWRRAKTTLQWVGRLWPEWPSSAAGVAVIGLCGRHRRAGWLPSAYMAVIEAMAAVIAAKVAVIAAKAAIIAAKEAVIAAKAADITAKAAVIMA